VVDLRQAYDKLRKNLWKTYEIYKILCKLGPSLPDIRLAQTPASRWILQTNNAKIMHVQRTIQVYLWKHGHKHAFMLQIKVSLSTITKLIHNSILDSRRLDLTPEMYDQMLNITI